MSPRCVPLCSQVHGIKLETASHPVLKRMVWIPANPACEARCSYSLVLPRMRWRACRAVRTSAAHHGWHCPVSLPFWAAICPTCKATESDEPAPNGAQDSDAHRLEQAEQRDQKPLPQARPCTQWFGDMRRSSACATHGEVV